MTTQTAATYVPTTHLPVEGRIFLDMTKRDVAGLIAALSSALADSDPDTVALEIALNVNRTGSGIGIGTRDGHLLRYGYVVDAGLRPAYTA